MKNFRLLSSIIYTLCSMLITALLSGATIKTLSGFYFSSTTLLIEVFIFSNVLILIYTFLFLKENFKEAFLIAKNDNSKSYSYIKVYFEEENLFLNYNHFCTIFGFFLLFTCFYFAILIYFLKRQKKNIYLKNNPNILKMEFEFEEPEKVIKKEDDDIIVTSSALSLNKV